VISGVTSASAGSITRTIKVRVNELSDPIILGWHKGEHILPGVHLLLSRQASIPAVFRWEVLMQPSTSKMDREDPSSHDPPRSTSREHPKRCPRLQFARLRWTIRRGIHQNDLRSARTQSTECNSSREHDESLPNSISRFHL